MQIKHLMFDIDGTLIQSVELDELLFVEAVESVSGKVINRDWPNYKNVTDTGLIQEFCETHCLENEFESLHKEIKAKFLALLKKHFATHPVQAIPGALEFLNWLKVQSDYSVALATGGWGESARMKLESAGFDIGDMPLKSSNDDYRRTQIMKKAQYSPKTIYFGDGPWDQRACAEIGFEFIAVGEQVDHAYKIADYLDREAVLALVDSLSR